MRKIIFILLLCVPVSVAGQSLDVANFYLVPNDLTALNEKTKVIDDNGNICALIKVETTQRGFSFDGGTVGIAKVDETQPGEIWVYVPEGLRRITIRHKELGVLRDYYFPVQIEGGRTYVMELISGKVVTSVQATLNSQYLVINFSPKEAMVEIDGEIVESENGVAMKYVKFGRHEYRVSMMDYHPEVGQVTINDPKNKVEVTVKLAPAYGWIKVTENSTNREASVYIDNRLCGRVPFRSGNLPSGQHDVKVVKSKYLPFRDQVFVTDGQVTEIAPSLTANFERIEFRMDGTPEIWINNQYIGKGNCTAELEPGEYVVEARMPSHVTQTRVINVRMGDHAPVNMPSPTPIYGRIDISSRPFNSAVYLDGKQVGKTPLFLQEVLIGSHRVQVKADGKENLDKTVEVREGETVTIDETLSDKRTTYVTATPVNNNSYGSRSGNNNSNGNRNQGSYTYTQPKSATKTTNGADRFVSMTLNYSYYKLNHTDDIPMMNGLNAGFMIQSKLMGYMVMLWGAEYQFAMNESKQETWMNHNLKLPLRIGFSASFGSKSLMTLYGGVSLDFNLSTTLKYKEGSYTMNVDFVSGHYQDSNHFSGTDKDLKLLKVFDIPLGVGIMYKFGKFGVRIQYEFGMLDRMREKEEGYELKASQLTAGIVLAF